MDFETYDPTLAHDASDHAKSLASHRAALDSLFLPESGLELKTITDQLSAAGFDSAHMHILGTGLWDVPGLGHQDPLIVGGWYAGTGPCHTA